MADTITVQYVHRFAILDLNTLATYPWEVTLPVALTLTADQVDTITGIIAAALPPNPYGWKVTAEIDTTTTTVSVAKSVFPEIDIPAQPGA